MADPQRPHRAASRLAALAGLWLAAMAPLAVAVVPVPAAAANRAVTEGLGRVEDDLDKLEGRMNRLAREYGNRRGLIGADEAVRRYEEAIYGHLVGEYERAALGFYTLVESEALTTPALHQDSEWFLAECLYELENWSTALSGYQRIIDAGPSHPYIGRAVSRTLEIHGLLRDNDAFYDVYRTYVLSGRVPATDSVKYTVAKSFYRQGEWGRAKAMFTELPVTSDFYARARYFTGTILAAEGEFEAALGEFRRVDQVKGGDAELRELTALAIGRIHYELANYREAVEAYQRVSSASDYFADQLYELTWTYIKQEAWQEAIDSVEIFTVAFPEHPYTVRMQIVEGHLHRKSAQYERALASYEDVVDAYAPIRDRLSSLVGDDREPAAFFERLVADQVLELDGQALPDYAMQLLVQNDELSRAVGARKELARQVETLENSDAVVREVALVLRSDRDQVGTFARGRDRLQRVTDDAIGLRIRLLELELDHLEQGASNAMMSDLTRVRGELEGLLGEAQSEQGKAATRSNLVQSFADQVAVVQGEGRRLAPLIADVRAELAALETQFADRAGKLDAEAQQLVDQGIVALRAEVVELERAQAELVSDARRRRVMSVVPTARPADDGSRAGISARLDALHREVRGLRSSNPSAEMATFSRVDKAWMRVAETDARATETAGVIDQVEEVEVAILAKTLDEQEGLVSKLHDEVDSVVGTTDSIAVGITQASLSELEGRLHETILEADMGIVDVYWLRKTEVTDRKTELKGERADRVAELEVRFALIRQKLEE